MCFVSGTFILYFPVLFWHVHISLTFLFQVVCSITLHYSLLICLLRILSLVTILLKSSDYNSPCTFSGVGIYVCSFFNLFFHSLLICASPFKFLIFLFILISLSFFFLELYSNIVSCIFYSNLLSNPQIFHTILFSPIFFVRCLL